VREYNFVWEFDTVAPPEALWTRMADTNRFNRDTGIPALQARMIQQRGTDRHLGFTFFGIPVEWDEEPFEWVRPHRFAVVRRYHGGPLVQSEIRVEFQARADGGTHLIYNARVTPRNVIGLVGVPLQIGILTRRGVARAVRQYDMELQQGVLTTPLRKTSALAPGGRARWQKARQALSGQGFDNALLERLGHTIEYGDEIALARMRPYDFADEWQISRRAVLELFLHATRAGVLDLEWDLLCPLCRGASYRAPELNQVRKDVHCDSCNIDYEVNFERSVELTFHPNPAVRVVNTRVYCLGGPQVTPHIYAQHHMPPRTEATIALPLEAGRYRLRTQKKRGGKYLFAEPQGTSEVVLRADASDWSSDEPHVNLEPHLIFENATADDQLFILERWAWSDQAVTAADVTALQTFRDLFSNEALRQGEQFSVGNLTLVFTDLKRSTELYRQIGDAPAFGRVLNHFDILRAAVTEHEGAVVKTMGDAVMAVFRRPANALRAMQAAQRALQNPTDEASPLALKVGIHSGTCIAVNLNERLDYFGTTVNIAARLASLADGKNILLSDVVYQDPEVVKWLTTQDGVYVEPFETQLKGYDEPIRLWRLEPGIKRGG
jgi:class 3 adenylate cyclase